MRKEKHFKTNGTYRQKNKSLHCIARTKIKLEQWITHPTYLFIANIKM